MQRNHSSTAAKTNPHHDKNYEKGLKYYENNCHKKACDYFTKALKTNQSDPYLYSYRAYCYLQLDKPFFALADLNQAIKLDPDHQKSHANRAAALCMMKEYNEAIKSLNRALELDPKDDSAWLNRAMAYSCIKDYEKSLLDFSSAIKLNSGYHKIYAERAEVYYERGEYQNAIQDYTQAIKLKPRHAAYYLNRAKCYAEMKDNPRALIDYLKTFEINKNNLKSYKYFEGTLASQPREVIFNLINSDDLSLPERYFLLSKASDDKTVLGRRFTQHTPPPGRKSKKPILTKRFWQDMVSPAIPNKKSSEHKELINNKLSQLKGTPEFKKMQESAAVGTAASVLGQAVRQGRIPNEIALKIATDVADKSILTAKEADQIACRHLGKPNLS